jgi:tape measure domain-containing protein
MADLGDLIARLLLDSSQWVSGMKQAESETKAGATEIEGSLAGISESLGKMGEALAGLAVAEGLKKFAEDAIEASDQVGKFSSAMVALKGNGEETTAFLEHIHELAATSPFAFPELAGAAQKMVQLGGSMAQVSDTMTAITQMGTALKMTSEQVSGIANSMAKLGAGADPMRVMKQLVSESVPAWQMLAEQLGTNMTDAQAKVKSGAISSDEVLQALTKSMGTYADTAGAWGDTWRGAMKGFQTESHAAMAAIGDDIKKALNDVGAPAIKAMTEGLKELTDWWKNLSPPVKDAILAFGGAVGIMAAVGGAISLLAIAIGAIGAPIAAAVLGIAAVVAALVALGEWVHEHWAGISEILTNTWDSLKAIWKSTWDDTIADVKQTWDSFVTDTKAEWDAIVGIVVAVWDTVTAVWKAVWDGIIAAVKFVWNTLKTELNIFDAILSFLLPFWDPIKTAFKAVWDGIVGSITTAWNNIKGLFDAATSSGSWLGKIAATFGIVKQSVTDLGTEMGKTVPKTDDLGTATKTLTGHLNDNNDALGKTSKAHVEVQDKFKATKDATAILWAESQILNGELNKLVQTIAANRLEADKMAASGQTLADKVTAVVIPVTNAAAGVEALGKAADKTMTQIASMSTVVGAAETAMKNLGAESTRAAQAVADKTTADKDQITAAGDMMTKYDNLMAKQADLKAQIDLLVRTDGDHKTKLEELQTALKDTTTQIGAMATSTTDAYHNMNLNTVADIQAIMDKDAARWQAAKDLADTGNPAMIKQAHEAELQMLKDYDQMGIDMTASQKQRQEDLEKELGKHHDTQKELWKTFEKDVKGDFDTTFKAMEDLLITGDGSFSGIMTKMWQGLAQSALDLFLTPLKTAIEDFIATTLKSLLGSGGFGGVSDAISKLGKDIGGLFSGSSSVPGAVQSVPGLPNVGATPGAPPGGAASAASGAIGAGLSGIVGVVSGVVSAISGVISNFQFAHMIDDLKSIEHNTRYTMMYVGERADGGILGILFKIDEELAWGFNTKATENLRDLFKDWSNPALAALEGIQNQLDGTSPYIVDTKVILEDIRDMTLDTAKAIREGFQTLNVTVTATGVTTAEAAKALGDQIAANLSRQLVQTS